MERKEFEAKEIKLRKELAELKEIKPMMLSEEIALEVMKEELEAKYKELVKHEIKMGW